MFGLFKPKEKLIKGFTITVDELIKFGVKITIYKHYKSGRLKEVRSLNVAVGDTIYLHEESSMKRAVKEFEQYKINKERT